MARTPQGRIAIGIALGVFYTNFEYQGHPYIALGKGTTSGSPLGVVFAKEVAMFSGVKHSYPTCKKK